MGAAVKVQVSRVEKQWKSTLCPFQGNVSGQISHFAYKEARHPAAIGNFALIKSS